MILIFYCFKHYVFQFPPPRGGRRKHDLKTGLVFAISIPAPAWGATRRSPRKPDRSHFNSRPRVGGDGSTKYIFQITKISIPAPAWGATSIRIAAKTDASKFQFPPPRGGRLVLGIVKGGLVYFNSRPRVGGDRRQARGRQQSGIYFNSRPRVGGDFGNRYRNGNSGISIPAPAWGATKSL